jgi:hypothetical protein
MRFEVETGSWPSETPVGIEPTITGLQPVAWPFGSSVEYPRQESNLISDLRRVVCHPPHSEDKSIPARIRTGSQTLEESDVAPLHHRDNKGRRLDSHQHKAVYGTAAFLYRATSAQAGAQGFEPCRAALETACSPRSTLLSQGCPGGIEPAAATFTGSHAKPLHHRHHPSAPRPGFEPGTPRSKRGMMVPFTIGASSGRQGSRTLISLGRTALAERPGQPYPATFRKWTARDSHPHFRRAGPAPSSWTSSPISDPGWTRTIVAWMWARSLCRPTTGPLQ